MTAITFSGAADWFAGTHAGTHHEVWAGNTSRDTLTMGYAPKMPLGFGSHVWFGGPKAFHDVDRGVTIYAVTSVSGAANGTKLSLVEVNNATGARTEVTVESITAPAADNHFYLTIYKRADNKYVVMWAFHDYGTYNEIRWFVSTNANSIASWGTVKTSTLAGAAYPIIYRLDGDGGRVVVIMRSSTAYSGDDNQYYAISTDDLDTLGSWTKFCSKQPGTPESAYGVFMQAYPDPDNTDRIWFIASDYFVNTYPNHQLDDLIMFYGVFSAGVPTFYAPDGTSLGSSVDWADCTTGNLGLAYDSGATGYSAWPLDLVVKNGVAYGVFVEEQNPNLGTVYNYKIAVLDFTGTPTLNVRTLWASATDGTNGTLATGTNAYPYPCGAVLCRDDPQRAWVSFGTGLSTTTNRAKIRLVTTANNWSTKSISTPSFTQGRCHNFHPVVPFISDFTTPPPAFCEMAYETGYLNTWASVHAMFVMPDWNGSVHAFDFNEGSGTPADKLFLGSVIGAPAKISTPTMGVTGINNGKALSFNGSSTAMNLGYTQQMSKPVVAAIMQWVNYDSVTALGLSGVSDSGNGRKFYGVNATNDMFLGTGNSSDQTGASGLAAGAWAHLGILVTNAIDYAGHKDGVLKNTSSGTLAEAGLNHWVGAVNNGAGGSSWLSGDMCQFIEDWAESRDAAWLLAIAGYAAAGTFTSAAKTAAVTNGPVVGPTVTPTATLPTGASYTLKLISTSTPAGQTKTGTASTPIVFDSVTIADGDSVSIVVAAASSDKTVAPSVTSFSIAA
jgi:hypothetical protein